MSFFFPVWKWGGKNAIWLHTEDGYLPALVLHPDPSDVSQPSESNTSGRGVLEWGDPSSLTHNAPPETCASVGDQSAAPLAILWAFSNRRVPRRRLGRGGGGAADFGEGPLGRRGKGLAQINIRARNIRSKALAALLRGCYCVCARASRWRWASYLWLWEITGWLERWVKQQTMKYGQAQTATPLSH